MPDNLTPDDLVRREVHYCVSALISNLANAYGHWDRGTLGAQTRELGDMCEQAFELAAPIDDWEEAALHHGMQTVRTPEGKWSVVSLPGPDEDGALSDMHGTLYDNLRHASIAYCDYHNVEPYGREVYEHWIVSDWLADKLEARGEKVDRDFAGMTVWARTTTGQAIALDSVIESICRDLPGEIEAALTAINTPKAEG